LCFFLILLSVSIFGQWKFALLILAIAYLDTYRWFSLTKPSLRFLARSALLFSLAAPVGAALGGILAPSPPRPSSPLLSSTLRPRYTVMSHPTLKPRATTEHQQMIKLDQLLSSIFLPTFEVELQRQ
jgi:hypothetical protein